MKETPYLIEFGFYHSIIMFGLSLRACAAAATALPLMVLLLNLTVNAPLQAPRVRRRLRFAPSTNGAVRTTPMSATAAAAPAAAAAMARPLATALPPPPPPPPLQAQAQGSPCDAGTEHVELWGSLVLAGVRIHPETPQTRARPDACAQSAAMRAMRWRRHSAPRLAPPAQTDNEQPTPVDCCRSCREYEPTPDVLGGAQCNAWVYHPTSRACWLKHQRPDDLKLSAGRLARGGGSSKVPWTSGVWLETRPCTECATPAVFQGCISKDRCNTSRACGSPAIDGYSHVKPKCLDTSPTAALYAQLLRAGTRLEAYADQVSWPGPRNW